MKTLPIDTICPNPDYPGFYLVSGVCPFCGKRHQHGSRGDLGHRVAHCLDEGDPGPGYVLALAPGVQWPGDEANGITDVGNPPPAAVAEARS